MGLFPAGREIARQIRASENPRRFLRQSPRLDQVAEQNEGGDRIRSGIVPTKFRELDLINQAKRGDCVPEGVRRQ